MRLKNLNDWSRILVGVLALVLTATEGIRAQRLNFPQLEKEMSISRKFPANYHNLPPLDTATPKQVETFTFGLG
jgi:hypothetical protein